MRTTSAAVRPGACRRGRFGLCLLVGQGLFAAGLAAADTKPAPPEVLAAGREIFEREWLPDDPRAHGGDGLGPVYNDTSCVACHNAGGPGGAGPVSKNIDILSASGIRMAAPRTTRAAAPTEGEGSATPPTPADPLVEFHAGFAAGRTVVLHRFGTDPSYEAWRRKALGIRFPTIQRTVELPAKVEAEALKLLSPLPIAEKPATTGVMTVTEAAVTTPAVESIHVRESIALRQAQTNEALLRERILEKGTPRPDRGIDELQQARMAMLAGGQVIARPQVVLANTLLLRSQRNPTPLFGIGLIDAIPEAVLEAAAERRFEEFPEIRGRVSRLKDGRIGKLGWKGQTADSEEFVLTACAVELGLEVPGHSQAIVPQAPKYQAGGLDLTADECGALVAFVRSLPRPAERAASGPEEAEVLGAGKALFASTGCAACHTPQLGEVAGLYSDLLLHDMGPELGDSGSYNGGSSEDDARPVGTLAGKSHPGASGPAVQAPRGATRQEWRTAPLWGFRDSGPYLHDGRAQTLEEAVVVHGGQGAASARRFFGLTQRERRQVEVFLKSLVAPPQLARAGE